MNATELRLAWRGVWRNPRRTALTVAATVFAIFLTVVSTAMQTGMHQKMIEDAVRTGSGHVTIAADGYLENRTLDYFIEADAELTARLDSDPRVEGWAPRITGFGLLSLDEGSQGAAILGVDPERESAVTTLAERVEAGRFLAAGRHGEIVLGARLADRLGAEIGDQILLYGVAYSLETAYELFTLVGTITLPNPQLERTLASITLADAQEFFTYGNRLSEIAVVVRDAGEAEGLRSELEAGLLAVGGSHGDHPPTRVFSWQEIMPELEQMLFLDDVGMWIVLAILVVVVGFGILNTILMAVLERTRELGVMLALGVRPAAVFRVVYIESMLLACVGITAGLVAAIPVALWMEAHPIPLSGGISEVSASFGMEPVIRTTLTTEILFFSSLAIVVVALLAAAYPAIKASRGNPVTALRSL